MKYFYTQNIVYLRLYSDYIECFSVCCIRLTKDVRMFLLFKFSEILIFPCNWSVGWKYLILSD